MISSNCTFKLLDKVHIGAGIRMTSDKNTVPFNNIPLTNVKIDDYGIKGFRLSHKDLPRTVWLEFDQLPLTKLTIENGIIKNEITFVENILRHKMEFIKTDTLDYIELLHIKKNEKIEQFSPITNIKPGEYIKSALCNGGADMIFLGIFYTKSIETVKKYPKDYYRSREYVYTHYLSKNSPQRAICLIVDNSISLKEQMNIAKQYNYYHYSDYNYNDKACDKNKAAVKRAETALLQSSNLDRFKIVNYPITSKQIKNVVKLNKSDNRFTNIEHNSQLILNEANTFYHYKNFYRQETLNTFNEPFKILKHELLLDFDTSTFVCVDSKADDLNYVSTSKENLDKKAIEFINENYTIQLEKEIYQ